MGAPKRRAVSLKAGGGGRCKEGVVAERSVAERSGTKLISSKRYYCHLTSKWGDELRLKSRACAVQCEGSVSNNLFRPPSTELKMAFR